MSVICFGFFLCSPPSLVDCRFSVSGPITSCVSLHVVVHVGDALRESGAKSGEHLFIFSPNDCILSSSRTKALDAQRKSPLSNNGFFCKSYPRAYSPFYHQRRGGLTTTFLPPSRSSQPMRDNLIPPRRHPSIHSKYLRIVIPVLTSCASPRFAAPDRGVNIRTTRCILRTTCW